MAISTLFNYLTVHINGQVLLVPVEFVIEVTKQKINRTLPGLKKGFVGITDLRHEIIPVFSISPFATGSDLVVMRVNNKKVGLVTDKVDTISKLDLSGTTPVKAEEFVVQYGDVEIIDVEPIGKVLG